jgi:hypothetical protein
MPPRPKLIQSKKDLLPSPPSSAPQTQLKLSFTDIKFDYQTKMVLKNLYSLRGIEKISSLKIIILDNASLCNFQYAVEMKDLHTFSAKETPVSKCEYYCFIVIFAFESNKLTSIDDKSLSKEEMFLHPNFKSLSRTIRESEILKVHLNDFGDLTQ